MVLTTKLPAYANRMTLCTSRAMVQFDLALLTLTRQPLPVIPSWHHNLSAPLVNSGQLAASVLRNLIWLVINRGRVGFGLASLIDRFYDGLGRGGGPPVLESSVIRVAALIDSITERALSAQSK